MRREIQQEREGGKEGEEREMKREVVEIIYIFSTDMNFFSKMELLQIHG